MTLSVEYFLLVLFAALAAIQYAVSSGGFRGLMLIQDTMLNRGLATVMATPTMIALFTWNDRNPVGVIEGAQQAGLFTLASLLAVMLVLFLSSILNHHRFSSPTEKQVFGLEALKNMTFFQALLKRFTWKH
ncbi:hypothetical protein DGWBC_0918 [Dehalogenimonas sp. WBC-2]|nr:hypothetical protein DGWBC_0918 [Dehalogenimonas sp. WBC-2]